MAKFTKYNNPSKKRKIRKINRSEADAIIAKRMLDDRKNGLDLPTDFYNDLSEKMSK